MNGDMKYRPFLRKALQSDDFVLVPLAGDASSRRYFRVVSDDKSYVLMSWEPFDKSNYPLLSVHSHFQKHGVHVPTIFEISESEGLILQEDLGDLTLERKFWENLNPENILPFYRMAIDELIKIHFHATSDKSPCSAFNLEFDHAKLMWELNHAFDHLFRKMLGSIKSDEQAAPILEELSQVATFLAKQPKHIVHRDYHSRNLMVRLNKVYVIDWQDARLGSITYDLTSLLKDPYVSINAELEKSLVKYYLQQASPFVGPNFDEQNFMKVYNVQAFQRCFKAVGTFTGMFNTKTDRRYLKHILPALETINGLLQNLPELSAFHKHFKDSHALDFRYEKL